MQLPSPIQSAISPRQVLAEDFKTIAELPIRGGWVYTKADACIIDKDDGPRALQLVHDAFELEKAK